jgi:hypothetical protein
MFRPVVALLLWPLRLSAACTGTDSRGLPWEAGVGSVASQNCSLVDDTLAGEARWRCEVTGWRTDQPDRRNCSSSVLAQATTLDQLEVYIGGLER